MLRHKEKFYIMIFRAHSIEQVGQRKQVPSWTCQGAVSSGQCKGSSGHLNWPYGDYIEVFSRLSGDAALAKQKAAFCSQNSARATAEIQLTLKEG